MKVTFYKGYGLIFGGWVGRSHTTHMRWSIVLFLGRYTLDIRLGRAT